MTSASSSSAFWRDAKRWLPGVIISIIAIIMVVRLASWQNVAFVWQSINLWALLVVILLTILSLLTRAFAWRVLLGYRLNVKNSFFAINIGYLLNNLFPLRLGEFGRSLLVGKDTGLGMVHVLSTVVIERALDLAFAAILLLSTISRVVDIEWIKPIAYTAIIAVVAGLVILFLMAKFQPKVKALALRVSAKSEFVRKYLLPQFDRLLDGFSVIGRPLELLKVFFWIGASWLIWVTQYYVMLVSVIPQAKFWWSVFADSLLALGVAVPSAPSGLGVYEAVLSWGLIQLGAGKDQAIAYAILMHLVQFSITCIFGLVGLALTGRSIMSLFKEVRKQPLEQASS